MAFHPWVFITSESVYGHVRLLESYDSVSVSPSVTLTSWDSSAFIGSATNSFTIDGVIFGDAMGVESWGSHISINAGGRVSSRNTAIGVIFGETFISNAGVIDGGASGSGIAASNNGSISLYNSGRIVGNTGIYSSNLYGNTIINDGIIEGWSKAIDLQGANSIANRGQINGGVYLDNGNQTITNHGFISGGLHVSSTFGNNVYVQNFGTINLIDLGAHVGGAIVNFGKIMGDITSTGGNSLDLHNNGIIVGNVTLSDAADYYIGTGGSSYGFVDGGAGADTLLGGASGDWLIGGLGADRLDGGGGDDVLDGGAGVDQIYGRAGDDDLDGGAGGDLLNGGDGIDTVSYASATAGVVVNLTAPNLNRGDAGGDRFVSIENIWGSNYNDSLTGNSGDNRIDGGLGTDRMAGLGGNDTYGVYDAGDVVIEAANAGLDTVEAWVNYALPANVENLVLIGDTAINGSGNALANEISGNDAGNRLEGAAGNDVLTGNGGADTFVFKTALGTGAGKAGVDDITDFEVGVDHVELNTAVFTKLVFGPPTPGTLLGDAALLVLAPGAAIKATHAADRILYNSGTGDLYYDADGSASAAAIKFATLSPGMDLHASDFLLA